MNMYYMKLRIIISCVKTREYCRKISSQQSMCPCVLIPTAVNHIGHVAELHWKCENGHSVSWTSSSIMGKDFSLKYNVLLAQLCSGMTPTQYQKFSEFLDVDTVRRHFRNNTDITLSNVIGLVTRQSVGNALAEEVATSGEDGISIMRDTIVGKIVTTPTMLPLVATHTTSSMYNISLKTRGNLHSWM